MSGKYWTDEDVAKLTAAWVRRSPETLVMDFCEAYAESVKRTRDSVFQKLKVQKEFRIPPSGYGMAWSSPPTIEGDVFVLMDAHIPFHHAEFISKCIDVCKRWGITKMVLGGDALDFHAFAQFPANFESDEKKVIDGRTLDNLLSFADTLKPKQREQLIDVIASAEREEGNISEEIRESRKVLKALEDQFDSILWIMGNHEQRVTRLLQKVLDVQSVSRLFGTDTPKWTISPYYWAKIISGGEEWQVEHPINTGKGSSKRLAPKFGCHIIMGHNHHFAVTVDPSGKFFAIEPGMGGDEARMGYVQQRHNAADTHMLGAIIIRNGLPTALNKFTDWDMLK